MFVIFLSTAPHSIDPFCVPLSPLISCVGGAAQAEILPRVPYEISVHLDWPFSRGHTMSHTQESSDIFRASEKELLSKPESLVNSAPPKVLISKHDMF